MSTDLSKPVVTVAIVLLLFVSILGTWVALTTTPDVTYTSGSQAGTVRINIEALPVVTGPASGQVQINILKGGQQQ